MGRIQIKSAARIAEIVASIAVVISLVFVAYSIRQNTAATQSIHDNFLYDMETQRLRDVSSDGQLASIIDRYRTGSDLNSTDELRYRMWATHQLNMWDIAFNRYRAGLLPQEQWEAWNNLWETSLPDEYPKKWWIEDRNFYNSDFVEHVDAAYSRK